jgi:hypothetical protein
MIIEIKNNQILSISIDEKEKEAYVVMFAEQLTDLVNRYLTVFSKDDLNNILDTFKEEVIGGCE